MHIMGAEAEEAIAAAREEVEVVRVKQQRAELHQRSKKMNLL